jgi:hypothetical protein
MKNRLAVLFFAPHFLHAYDSTPPACADPSAGRPARGWPAQKTAENGKYAGQAVLRLTRPAHV